MTEFMFYGHSPPPGRVMTVDSAKTGLPAPHTKWAARKPDFAYSAAEIES